MASYSLSPLIMVWGKSPFWRNGCFASEREGAGPSPTQPSLGGMEGGQRLLVASVTGKRWRRGVAGSGPITTLASLVAMTTVLTGQVGLLQSPCNGPGWVGGGGEGSGAAHTPRFLSPSPLPYTCTQDAEGPEPLAGGQATCEGSLTSA